MHPREASEQWGSRAMGKMGRRLQNHLLEHQQRPVGHEYAQDDLTLIHQQPTETHE